MRRYHPVHDPSLLADRDLRRECESLFVKEGDPFNLTAGASLHWPPVHTSLLDYLHNLAKVRGREFRFYSDGPPATFYRVSYHKERGPSKDRGEGWKTRPYDDFLPNLSKVKERRRSPTGVRHEVPVVKRGRQECFSYPWAKMELGDYFVVPIGTRSVHALRVSFHHAAARFDYEIAVRSVDDNGEPSMRVTVTVIGVSAAKRAAIAVGINVKISDGRWKERKRQWERNNRTVEATRQKTRSSSVSVPVFKEEDKPLPIDRAISSLSIEPERHLTRAEILARVLEQDKG